MKFWKRKSKRKKKKNKLSNNPADVWLRNTLEDMAIYGEIHTLYVRADILHMLDNPNFLHFWLHGDDSKLIKTESGLYHISVIYTSGVRRDYNYD
jgi:hypothetical protein